jgi:hypothetical protein
MFTVVLESKSTRADVTTEWLAKVAAALTVQLQRDFCPDWGLASWTCTTDSAQPGPRVTLFDDSDQAGALGYHALDPQGNPYGKVFALDQSLDGISVTTSHEVLELVGDQSAAGFELGADGKARAREACDACEDITYSIDAVAVSDFVTPAWFLDGSAGPWTHCNALPGPQTRTAGGYVILLENGKVDTDPPEAKSRPGKAHPASRTARRLRRSS